MALNDVYKVSCVFSNTKADGDMVITHHYALAFINTGLSEAGYCEQIAQALKADYETHYLPLISNKYTLERVDAFNVTQPQFQGTSASGTDGSIAGADLVSLRSAIVIAKKSGLRGRRYNGRMFMLAPTEAQQADGDIISSLQTSLQDFCDDHLIKVVAGNLNEYNHIVWSDKFSIGTPVETYIVRATLGSQRGRQTAS